MIAFRAGSREASQWSQGTEQWLSGAGTGREGEVTVNGTGFLFEVVTTTRSLTEDMFAPHYEHIKF